ncbi:flagellar motor protein MotB [Bacillus sp. S3]|uniref:flagellar motor protein MotB n=1 Tax=Bacillus sp. S3 TaxID=486398 RepID=UPI00118919F0|nr:flagellar motor protein MotB [Bacillus sp. S3]QCJ42359.1 flagellar motor protein MotB [Bacillus sp. S3]
MKNRRKHFDDEHEEHIDESWLIPYADIMTLLLALFIVLFASSVVDKQKFMSIMESFKSELTGTKIESNTTGLSVKPSDLEHSDQAPNEPQQQAQAAEENIEDQELLDLKGRIEKYIADNQLQADVSLQDTKRGVEITFKEVILFDPGRANLKESSYHTLDAIIGLINTVPNPISIEGHTDNVPIRNSTFPSNWELSSARAVSVLHYFEEKNVTKERLQFVGFGEYKPIFPNDSAEHKQANRRVNIVILRNS